MGGRSITTVVPSTTPAALTSITTGLPPSTHGVTGYRMRRGRRRAQRDPVAARRRAPSARSRRDPAPRRSSWAVPVPVVTKSEFRTSGFTGVHLRGGRLPRLADHRGARRARARARRRRRAPRLRLLPGHRRGRARLRPRRRRGTPPSSRPPTGSSAQVLDAVPADVALRRDRRPRPGAGRSRRLDRPRRARRARRRPTRATAGSATSTRGRAPPPISPPRPSELPSAATRGCSRREQLLDEGWLGPEPSAGDPPPGR